MLSEILEETIMKCTQYWPEVGCAEQFGAIHVTCESEKHYAYHTVRIFRLLLRGMRARGAMQTVTQYQVRPVKLRLGREFVAKNNHRYFFDRMT